MSGCLKFFVAPRLMFAAGACAAGCCISQPATAAYLPPALAANNAALQALASTAYPGAVRQGYANPGDAPPLTYTASRAPCSLNGGAGDGGYQVPTADGKCWIATFPNGRADIREWGADPTGASYSTGALAKIFALPVPMEVRFPAGTYRVACGNFFVTTSALSLAGAGAGATTIRYDAGCTITDALLDWNSVSGVRVQDVTFDLNTPAGPASITDALLFYAYTGDVNGLSVQRVKVINGTSPVFLVGVAASGGHTFTNPVIRDSYFSLTAAAPSQNQCIGLSTNNAAGRITGFTVANNLCVNTAIQIDGDHGTVSGNDVTAFQFGTGIFMAFDSGGAGPSDHDNVVDGNVLHDAPSGLDVNNTATGGIENNCQRCTISKNIMHHLGGSGIDNYGSFAAITGNVAYDNGKNGSGGAGGAGDQAAYHIAYSTPLGAPYNSGNVVLTGNVAYDDGPGTQSFGYFDDGNAAGPITLNGNKFTGAVQALKINSASGVLTSDWTFRAPKRH